MGITEMKCPACGAPLKFSASAGKVVCEYCGTAYEIADLIQPKTEDTEKDENSAVQSEVTESAGKVDSETGDADGGMKTPEVGASQRGETAAGDRKQGKRSAQMGQNQEESEEGFHYDWGDVRRNIKLEPLEDARGYICRSCGAELVTTATTVSMRCPYCDNEIVLDERVSGSVRPNAIIPFKIDAKELPEILKNFYKKKPLLPNKFFDDHRISETQGVYVPYWLFSGDVDVDLHMEGTKTRFYSAGDYDYTEVSVYGVDRSGNLGFAGVPVDAHSRVENIMTESIEPYDWSELTEYQNLYLAGFVTDRFDADPDACIDRAQERMNASAETAFKQTAAGYDSLRVKSGRYDLQDVDVKYVLLPAYFIRCEYKGEEYRFAVNGQTGKVVGNLPIDKGKQNRAFFGAFGIVAAVAFAISLFFV